MTNETVKTTKICPKCGCTDLSLLHGEDKKLCTGCGHEIDWPLDEGQKSIFKKNVVGTKPTDGELYAVGQTAYGRACYQEAVDRVANQ